MNSIFSSEIPHLDAYPDSNPGIFRKKNGNDFVYIFKDTQVTNKKVLKRIFDLHLPPAWKEVWISPKAASYLQATGRDERGRKQYRYHNQWIAWRQQYKFGSLITFGELLPLIRQNVTHVMHQKGLNKEKVTATVIWLLNKTFSRIGNKEYVKENNSYGLTTLVEDQVEIHKDTEARKGFFTQWLSLIR